MTKKNVLASHEDRWATRMGAWFAGQRIVFRGRDLLNDLVDLPWMGLLLYGITGRILDHNQIQLFEALWKIGASFPDPRLWNNRVTALAGTTRSTAGLAIGAGVAVSEASIYGRRPDIRAIDFLLRAQEKLDQGVPLAQLIKGELKKYRGIPGYGRPYIATDERIAPLLKQARGLGHADGRHVKLAFLVEQFLRTGRWRWHMNVAALCAALAADQGLSPREYYHFAVLSFTAGMFPCHLDAHEKAEGAFFPLRCDRISYQGQPRRKWGMTEPQEKKPS